MTRGKRDYLKKKKKSNRYTVYNILQDIWLLQFSVLLAALKFVAG